MTSTPALTYRLNRTIHIDAPRPVVFDFFLDSERWASWWGHGSTIDARPGGRLSIRFPGGVEVTGDVLEIHEPERVVFTYGFASGSPIPPGGSRVTITLEGVSGGTRVHLLHEFADERVRDEHVQGWRFQLSLFANAVANRLYQGVETIADRWFEAWADPDEASRVATLQTIATPEVVFRDRYSLLSGIDDVSAHIAAAQRFMPGIRIVRNGDARHCQGMVLVDWRAADSSGAVKATGSHVFTMNPDRRIVSATGFWSA